MKMNKKFSITLFVAMFSFFIIGFGGAATAQAAGKCLEIASIDLTAVELVGCRIDSAYLAANPELMTSYRFVVADSSATDQPVSVAIEILHNNYYKSLQVAQTDLEIKILRNNYYKSLQVVK